MATSAPALFHVVGADPVIPRGAFPDRGAVLPGAVAVDDGALHAWVIAFGDPPGTQEIHHLRSSDGFSWVERADTSLVALSDGLGNPGAMPSSVFDDGTAWVMYFVGTEPTQPPAFVLRRATAPGPDGPWTRDEEPVLVRGPAGAWDSGTLDFPTVLDTDDGYTMLYAAVAQEHQAGGSIGLATSTDGITWTKHDDPATTDPAFAESDPVIEPGLCGGFDDRAMGMPRVVAIDDRLVLVYAGYAGDIEAPARVGYAASDDDGLTWTCGWPSPALETTGMPEGFVHTLTAFALDGQLSLLVEWFSGRGTDVWLAEGPIDLP